MSKVYYIKTVTGERVESVSEKAVRVLKKSRMLEGLEKDDFAAIKTHFGEKRNTGHVDAACIKALAGALREYSDKVFITETNTLYRGSRSNSADHLRLASEHGFDLRKTGVPVIIADGLMGRSFRAISIEGERLKSVRIASDISDLDFMLCVSHMTGHMQTGFGAALKNLGMGCASRAGKLQQHESVLPAVTADRCTGCGSCLKICPAEAISLLSGKAMIDKKSCIGCGECVVVCRTGAIDVKWSENIMVMQQKMAEYALGARKAVGDKGIVCMNFVTHVTRDCDCMAKDDPAIGDDVGILVSGDPVAIDAASFDLMKKANGRDVFRDVWPAIDSSVQLAHAEKIGLGKRGYELEEVS